jgi:hypothetical protein
MKNLFLLILMLSAIITVSNAQKPLDYSRQPVVVCLQDDRGTTYFNDKTIIKINPFNRSTLTVQRETDIVRKNLNTNKFIRFSIPNTSEYLDFIVVIIKKSGVRKVFNQNPVQTIRLEEVLNECESGDKIEVMLKDNRNFLQEKFTMEIVEGGC